MPISPTRYNARIVLPAVTTDENEYSGFTTPQLQWRREGLRGVWSRRAATWKGRHFTSRILFLFSVWN